MKSQAKLLRTLLTWGIVGLAGVLFARSLQSNWDNLEGLDLRPDLLVGLSLVCFVLSIVSSGLCWGNIVDELTGQHVPAREAIRIHLASWLLKYIPGQAGSLLNKLSWAKKKGIDGKKITASFVYENVFLLLASTIPTIPILLLALGNKFTESGNLFWPLLAAAPLVVVILTPRFFTLLINQLFRVLKKQKLSRGELLTGRDNVVFLLQFIIPRIVNGAAFVLLAVSFLGIPPSQYLVFGALYVLAGIVGVLAIFVPSGLGVREAVIVLFASAYVPVEQAIALSLLARFYATAADILVALLYTYLTPRKGKEA